MAKHAHTLDEKFDLTVPRQLLTGTQAIVRLMLMQKARDTAAGLNTAGYVTGYRGSPIATLEGAFERAAKLTKAHDIVFHPGLNEDLAATAVHPESAFRYCSHLHFDSAKIDFTLIVSRIAFGREGNLR